MVAAINAYIKAVFASRPFDDVLGRVHAELLARKGGEGLGQSFTPGDLLDLVQALATRHRPGGSGAKVYDSCCGAGSLALAAIRSQLKHLPSEKSWCWRGHRSVVRSDDGFADPRESNVSFLAAWGGQSHGGERTDRSQAPRVLVPLPPLRVEAGGPPFPLQDSAASSRRLFKPLLLLFS